MRPNAHALGRTGDGRFFTDSLEAFNYSYARGIRSFETDINITKDGDFAISHDFRLVENLTLSQFMAQKKHGVPLDLSAVFCLMNEHRDAFFMFDYQPSCLGLFCGNLEYLNRFCDKIADPNLIDRCVIEISTNWNLTQIVLDHGLNCMLWIGDDQDVSRFFSWPNREKVKYVSMAYDLMTKDLVHRFHELGIIVYVCGIDSIHTYWGAWRCGVDFYTTHFTDRYNSFLSFCRTAMKRKFLWTKDEMIREELRLNDQIQHGIRAAHDE